MRDAEERSGARALTKAGVALDGYAENIDGVHAIHRIVVDVSGVLYYMRSDDATLVKGFGKSVDGKQSYQTLEDMIGWMEAGTIPKDRISPVDYLAFFADPSTELERLYRGLGMPLSSRSKNAMLDYIRNKPKDKFGKHDYELGDAETIASLRAAFRPFQDYFGVASEI